MGNQRRTVRRSPVFLDQAGALFPRGGSAEGRPSFELFEDSVLRAVEYQFSVGFDELPVSEPGLDAIRHVMTHGLPWIPPLIVYGILLSNDEIELIGIDVDVDYVDPLDTDPDR